MRSVLLPVFSLLSTQSASSDQSLVLCQAVELQTGKYNYHSHMKSQHPRMLQKQIGVLTATLLLISLFASIGYSQSPQYSLPVTLGLSSGEVRAILGPPKEIVNPSNFEGNFLGKDDDNFTLQYFYSSGIVGRFDHGNLFGITLNPRSTYRGFLIYSGPIVNSVRLVDDKETILSKLGKPTKIENDALDPGVDPNVPVVSPKESRYYWRFSDFAIQVDFLRQAQKLDGTHTLPRNAVTLIQVYK